MIITVIQKKVYLENRRATEIRNKGALNDLLINSKSMRVFTHNYQLKK